MNDDDKKELIPTPHQKEIIEGIIKRIDEKSCNKDRNDRMVELSGAAGSGKSFSIGHIVKHYKEKGWKIALTSPTHSSLEVVKVMANAIEDNDDESWGMSSDSIMVSTIHSFLKLKLTTDFASGKQFLKKEHNKKTILNKCDLLIVDEKSMVGRTLYEYIHEAVHLHQAKVVLLVGDKYQLPVVDDEMVDFAKSDVFELKEVVRQALENPLIRLSVEIRKCIEHKRYIPISKLLARHIGSISMTSSRKEFMDVYFADEYPIEDRVVGAYRNVPVDDYNKFIRNTTHPDTDMVQIGDTIIIQQPNVIEEGEFTTISHNNGEYVKIVNTIEKQKIVNNQNINVVTCVCPKNKPMRLLDDESRTIVNNILDGLAKEANAGYKEKVPNRNKISSLWKEFYKLKESYPDFKYPMSMTIHKLQGSSFPSVYGDITDMQMFQGRTKEMDDTIFRLFYVLVTRSSDKLLLLTL